MTEDCSATLFGDDHLVERLLGLSFRISPAAFFQVNTAGAEALCRLLRQECGLESDTVLLDVCCGTGTLGLTLASAVQRVIGTETRPEPDHPASEAEHPPSEPPTPFSLRTRSCLL